MKILIDDIFKEMGSTVNRYTWEMFTVVLSAGKDWLRSMPQFRRIV